MRSGLRIAVDLDGTIADLSATMHAVATRHRPAPPAAHGIEAGVEGHDRPALRDLGLTSRQLDALWKKVLAIPNFWTTLDEIEPGSVARLAALAAERRWDVLFITTRPTAAGDTTQVQSQRWLRAHGFDCPSVYVVKGSRGKLADALKLDAVVDDRPENCFDVAVESTARALLVWPGSHDDLPPTAVHPGLTVVPAFSNALDVLIEIDGHRRHGVARSIRRLFSRR